jgi:hypothetical protein
MLNKAKVVMEGKDPKKSSIYIEMEEKTIRMEK